MEESFVFVPQGSDLVENMDDLEAKAKDWISKSNFNYKLEVNKEDNKIIFKTDEGFSFYVMGPDQDGKFSAWSEKDEVLSNFQQVQEFCDSNKATSFTELLNVAHKVILKVSKNDDDDDDDDEVDDGYEDEADDDIEDYYGGEDIDVQRDTEPIKADSEEDEETENFFGAGGSPAAMSRLLKDLKSMQKESIKFGIEGTPRGDNLFVWDVKLTGFPEDTKLGQDLKSFASNNKREPVIYLEMQFPGDYPMAPPFVRVIRPRFKFLTGHVTIGGSICMEMLTKSGWRPTNDIESILVQVRSEIMSDPNARLDSNPDRAYGEQEARDAFHRMVSRYNWNK